MSGRLTRDDVELLNRAQFLTPPTLEDNPVHQAVQEILDAHLAKFKDLADRWDADLQREFSVDSKYTDYHSRELRRLLDE